MTNETVQVREAREVLADHVGKSWREGIISGQNNDWGHIRPSEAIAAMLAFAARHAEQARSEEGARVAALEAALRFFAEKPTIQESLSGTAEQDEWLSATVERRIEMMGERKRANDEAILRARALLAPPTPQVQP